MKTFSRFLSVAALFTAALALSTAPASAAPKTKKFPKQSNSSSVPKSAPSSSTPVPPPGSKFVPPTSGGEYTQVGQLSSLRVSADGKLLYLTLRDGTEQENYAGCGVAMSGLPQLAVALPHKPQVAIWMKNKCLDAIQVMF